MGSEQPATTWGIGDYAEMAVRLDPAAELLLERLEVRPDERVLDLGCGTGNAALAAARRGAIATGLDFEPALLSIARERAAKAGLEVEWLQGDIEKPSLAGTGFDAVVSVFGVMYVPDQAAGVRALVGACATDGRIGLTAWTPGSFMPAVGAALAPYLPPPPPGGGPPSRWGDRDALAELLSAEGARLVDGTYETLPLEFGNRDEAVDFLLRTAGHVMAERPRLEAEGRWPALVADMRELIARSGSTSKNGVRLELSYLLAIGAPAR